MPCLRRLRAKSDTPLPDFPAHFLTTSPDADPSGVNRVWARLQTFPHCFEIAEKQHGLHTLKLDGTVDAAAPPQITLTHLYHQGWSVHANDVQEFVDCGTLEPPVLELLLHSFRARVDPDLTCFLRTDQLSQQKVTPTMKWKRFQKTPSSLPEWTFVPYRSRSKHWALYALHKTAAGEFTLDCYLPRWVDDQAFDWATKHVCATFRVGSPSFFHSEA